MRTTCCSPRGAVQLGPGRHRSSSIAVVSLSRCSNAAPRPPLAAQRGQALRLVPRLGALPCHLEHDSRRRGRSRARPRAVAARLERLAELQRPADGQLLRPAPAAPRATPLERARRRRQTPAGSGHTELRGHEGTVRLRDAGLTGWSSTDGPNLREVATAHRCRSATGGGGENPEAGEDVGPAAMA